VAVGYPARPVPIVPLMETHAHIVLAKRDEWVVLLLKQWHQVDFCLNLRVVIKVSRGT
jgi:hypothetical protein